MKIVIVTSKQYMTARQVRATFVTKAFLETLGKRDIIGRSMHCYAIAYGSVITLKATTDLIGDRLPNLIARRVILS